MNKALLGTLLFLGASACAIEEGEGIDELDRASEVSRESALGKGEPGGPTAQSVNRRQCGAFSVSLRSTPGGNNILAQIYMNEIVDVWSTDGVWHYVWHFGTNQWGYTLAQYYCPVF